MTEHKNPKVFISYAWEDDTKMWVRELAVRLRSDGIDAILDDWTLSLGDLLPEFMEKSVSESDFVLVVCTPRYKEKSDSHKSSGVKWEKGIITGELFSRHNHKKFIPVLQKDTWANSAPAWTSGKVFVDLRGDTYREKDYRYLVKTLYGRKEVAPPLGSMPSFVMENKAKTKEVATEKALIVAAEKAREEKEKSEKEALEKKLAEEKSLKEKEAREKELAEEKARKEKEALEKKLAEEKALNEKEAREKKLAEEKARKEKETREKKLAEEKARKANEVREKKLAQKRAREIARKKKLAENPAGIEWIKIPAGEFTMGSNDYEDEKPSHKVYLDEYYIAKTPTTNAQFKKFVDAGGYKKKAYWSPRGWRWLVDDHNGIPLKKILGIQYTQPRYWNEKEWNALSQPVVGVSWYEAEAFCEWAKCCLPSEAEWEKAARGTDGRTYPWGNQAPRKNLANFAKNIGKTTPVGKYSPAGDSPYGCVDMVGNVGEWCADNYIVSPSDFFEILRGGAWDGDTTSLRVAHQSFYGLEHCSFSIGFRCSLKSKIR